MISIDEISELNAKLLDALKLHIVKIRARDQKKFNVIISESISLLDTRKLVFHDLNVFSLNCLEYNKNFPVCDIILLTNYDKVKKQLKQKIVKDLKTTFENENTTICFLSREKIDLQYQVNKGTFNNYVFFNKNKICQPHLNNFKYNICAKQK